MLVGELPHAAVQVRLGPGGPRRGLPRVLGGLHAHPRERLLSLRGVAGWVDDHPRQSRRWLARWLARPGLGLTDDDLHALPGGELLRRRAIAGPRHGHLLDAHSSSRPAAPVERTIPTRRRATPEVRGAPAKEIENNLGRGPSRAPIRDEGRHGGRTGAEWVGTPAVFPLVEKEKSHGHGASCPARHRAGPGERPEALRRGAAQTRLLEPEREGARRTVDRLAHVPEQHHRHRRRGPGGEDQQERPPSAQGQGRRPLGHPRGVLRLPPADSATHTPTRRASSSPPPVSRRPRSAGGSTTRSRQRRRPPRGRSSS